MSPEQLQGKEADARSDLFSFGCVLYEMLTGKRAFEGASPASVIAAILEREPAPLEVARPLDRVVRRSLAKDPDQRFQTARDLKAALSWVAGTTTSARGSARPTLVGRVTCSGADIGRRWGGWTVLAFPPTQGTTSTPARHYSSRRRPVRFQGLTSGGIALSPDGNIAAFVASAHGKIGLWIRPLNDTSARLLPGTENPSDPFWSPDGRSIAFFAAGRLQRVELAGGSPLTICEVPGMIGGAWGDEGRIIFGSLGTGLFQIFAVGGKPSSLTTLDMSRGENTHRSPQILPGGRFLYFARSDKPEYTGIYVASFSKPAERVFLLATETNAVYAPSGDGRGYLLWLRGGTLMAQKFDAAALKLSGDARPIADPVSSIGTMGVMVVSASRAGQVLYSASGEVSQLTWLDRTGMLLGTVGEPGGYTYPFRLSPDGRRVAASRDRSGGNDLWLLDFERGISSRFTSTSRSSVYPVWSPDGRTIIFTRDSEDLFRKDADGTGDAQLVTQLRVVRYATDWSRDGRFVLHQNIGGQLDLSILPVTLDGKLVPGAKPIPYLKSQFDERYGRFSPEASPRWIAFQSDETGRFEVYIQAFPEPHGRFQISTEGGRYPQWGAGGRELFYLDPENRLMVVELNISGDTVHPSKPRALFTMPIIDNGWPPYDTGSDGQRFLVRAVSRQVSQALTVIANWPALLKKGATAP